MEKKLPLEECSISQIYIEGQKAITYKIPVYQRNYAWEEDQIRALIKDVYDSFKTSKPKYYIGTLVTYKRDEGVYEVIDGQQRLTTIYIILKVLGIKNIRNRLTYEARKVSAATIGRLDDYPDMGDEVDEAIINGYKYAQKAIDENEIVETGKRQDFIQYLLHNVHIIHYNVPKDVDLNHYFEVMNSRGEQLEKHEIIKSKLSQCLKHNEDIATFNHVWEACSEMNIYIQQALDDVAVFGKHLDTFNANDFDDIPHKNDSEGKVNIKHLLNGATSKIDDKDDDMERKDKFQPIIDFPNFLLIVLKITMSEYEGFDPTAFILDDKELIEEFDKSLDTVVDREVFAKDFVFYLLKGRYYLDNYIVHHTLIEKEAVGENPWNLQYYYYEKKKGYPVNLIGQKKQDIQDELVHLLSMFEVTFTPRQRKNYLYYCLMYLFENEEPSGEDYLKFLQKLAAKYFYNVYLNRDSLSERNQPKPNAFDEVLMKNGELNVDDIGCEGVDYKAVFEDIYQKGKADVPLYVFNYTDYLLWKKYLEELRGKSLKRESKERASFFKALGCSDFGLDFFDDFYFSRTRKSLEHYYPQAKARNYDTISNNDLNCFGNFAMIGAEANSSGSDWDPKAKLDHYDDRKSNPVSVASIKFKIMMQRCKDNNGWNAEDIQQHQERMLNIIFES